MRIDLRNIPTFYINMEKHVERNNDMIQLGKDVNFKDYNRVNGVSLPRNPRSGCAKSHHGI